MVAIGVVNKYSALDIMDCLKYSREIMADRTNGFLQLMSSNNMLYSNLNIPETKEVPYLITEISPFCSSSSSFA